MALVSLEMYSAIFTSAGSLSSAAVDYHHEDAYHHHRPDEEMYVMPRILCAILLLIPAELSFASDPAFYIRKDSWNETMLVSREALTARRGEPSHANQPLLSTWRHIGPFTATTSAAFSEVFPPEQALALDTAYSNLRWTDHPEWHDGKVTSLGSDTMCAHYLFRTISVRRDTTIVLSLGSDDGIRVWLNGKQVLANDINRSVEPDQERLTVPLHQGSNALLIKINNNYGPTGFFFAVEDTDIRTLWELVRRDFPDSTSMQEMEWETADSIWVTTWSPGDVRPLAIRYADHAQCETQQEFRALSIVAQAANTLPELADVRRAYLTMKGGQLARVVLTPKAPLTPRINGPRRVGARPGHPFLFMLPISGERPISVRVTGLPRGLRVDPASGVITGSINTPGTYTVGVLVSNARGKTKGTLTIVIGPMIALTPPLGWNSWNCFASAVDDQRVRRAADAMIATGLSEHGWSYINIDDCWEIKPGSTDSMLIGEPRTADGMINTNRKFPDMHALSNYIHAKGLKMGIYSSPGPLTCGGYTASYEHETQDAQQYSSWGIDYLKYDWCSYDHIAKDRSLEELQKPYRVMRAALDKVWRDIVFHLCQYGMGDVWEWGAKVGGNCWRTTGDIQDTWESMSHIGFSQSGHESQAGPGHWNDPDMLVVGKVGWGPTLHPSRLTPNEQYTHISLWCLLAAPLLIGCDMTQMDDFTLGLFTNDEVLAVNQDPLGRQARKISTLGDLEVWAKEMEDSSYAVGLFNRGRWKEEITVRWSDIGLSGRRLVRDLWRQKDLGTYDERFSAVVPSHGVVLVRIGAR
jgi:alpha-galactosidase